MRSGNGMQNFSQSYSFFQTSTNLNPVNCFAVFHGEFRDLGLSPAGVHQENG